MTAPATGTIIAVSIIPGLLLLYFILVAGPALVMYRVIFSRKSGIGIDEMAKDHPNFGRYREMLLAAEASLSATPSRRLMAAASDGTILAADYYGRGKKALAICFHGYRASPMTNFCVLGKDLMEFGFDLLFVHHRGHGASYGRHNTLGIMESDDVLSWIEFANRYLKCDRILLCGVSMGAATIAMAADRIHSPKVHGMILDCCFVSPYEQICLDLKKFHLPAKVLAPVIRRYARRFLGIDLCKSARDSLAKTDIPAFFLHGSKDDVAPLNMADSCYEACAGPKEMLIVDGAGHGTAYLEGYEDAKPLIRTFTARYFGEDL